MKSRLILLALAAHAGAALAQYKCTAANGAITFQQTPCFGAKAEEKLSVVPNGHPPAASGAKPASAPAVAPPQAPPQASAPAKVETNMDKRMLAKYELQHRRDALEQTLKNAQDDKAKRATERDLSLAAARKQFGTDPANAASLRDATTSINSRYDALGELGESRIKSAQAALDDWDRARREEAAAKH